MPVGDDPLAALLAGTYPDPDTGELLAADTRSLVIEDSLDGREVELVAALGVGPHVAVVSDRVTHAALAARIERALASTFTVQSVILPAPHADAATVERLVAALAPETNAIIAVGSGTLNDLCKMAAFERQVPQVVFATAASMNGYTSVSASITVDGIKRSFRTHTPAGAFFDLSVLAAAPLPLTRAGLGDSTARSTAQADWLLAHLLLDRPYREAPFALLTADEDQLLREPAALAAGDRPAMRALVRTLVLSGFGMTLCNGSFPASQGEHLLGHYLELIHPLDVLHGAQIGVCTLVMARLQETMLRAGPPTLRASPVTQAQLVHAYGARTGAACWDEYNRKRLDSTRAAELTARLAARWDEIRTRIERVKVSAEAIASVLTAVGAPTSPAALGYTDDEMSRAVRNARILRDRYTFLDLAADAT
jgi:glycerol-1-phosphate dehydrogenase [NAD(P)+]